MQSVDKDDMTNDQEAKIRNGRMCWQGKFASVEEKTSPITSVSNRGIETNMEE